MAVTAVMTTLPRRVKHCKLAVESLYAQVDRLHVVLDGHDAVPRFLQRPKIEAILSPPPCEGRKKFLWGDRIDGYVVYADDDIVYPSDYVETMIAAIERHARKAVVGVLVKILCFPMTSYMTCRIPLPSPMPLCDDVRVHVLGTGTMAHHTDTIRFTLADYPDPNMSDVWTAIKAKRAGVPLFVIARPAYWLDTLAVEGFTIQQSWMRHPDRDQRPTQVVRAEAPWPALSVSPEIEQSILEQRRRWPYVLRRIERTHD